MKSFRKIVFCLALIAAGALIGRALSVHAAAEDAKTAADNLPKDIYPDSRNRLPSPKREDLPPEAQALYDNAVKGIRSGAGLRGPGGLRLHDPKLDVLLEPAAQYIRFDMKLGAALTQVAMLVTAREMNCEFEWRGHEQQALEAGVSKSVIDVIRNRGPLTGIGEKEAAIIQLGREDFQKHSVSSATFARALKALGKVDLIDAMAAMGHQADTALILAAFDQHLAPGQKSNLPMP